MEELSDAVITMMEVDPFGHTQTGDGIIATGRAEGRGHDILTSTRRRRATTTKSNKVSSGTDNNTTRRRRRKRVGGGSSCQSSELHCVGSTMVPFLHLRPNHPSNSNEMVSSIGKKR